VRRHEPNGSECNVGPKQQVCNLHWRIMSGETWHSGAAIYDVSLG
jgi:hypothetical protein